MSRMHNVCWKCQENPPAPGKTACNECLTTERERSRMNYARQCARVAAPTITVHTYRKVVVREIIPTRLDDMIHYASVLEPPLPIPWAAGVLMQITGASESVVDGKVELHSPALFYAPMPDYVPKVAASDGTAIYVMDQSQSQLMGAIAHFVRHRPAWRAGSEQTASLAPMTASHGELLVTDITQAVCP